MKGLDFLLIVPPIGFNGYPSIQIPFVYTWLENKGFSVQIFNGPIEFLGSYEAKYGDRIQRYLDGFLKDVTSSYEIKLLYNALLAAETNFEENGIYLANEAQGLESFNIRLAQFLKNNKSKILCFILEFARSTGENYPWIVKTINEYKDFHGDSYIGIAGDYLGLSANNIENIFKKIINLDYLVLDEAEKCLEDIGNKLIRQNIDPVLLNIKGVANKRLKKININKERNFINELDEIPYTMFSQMQPEKYLQYRIGAPIISIFSTRGCVNRCAFCFQQFYQAPYRERKIENVVNEMCYYYDRGFRLFRFYDCAINCKNSRLKEMADQIIATNKEMYWGAMFLAHKITEDLVELIYRAGCRLMWIGVEFLDSELQRKYKKHLNLDDLGPCLKRIKKYDIKVVLFFIRQFPEEKDEHKKAVDDFINEYANYVDYFHYSELAYYKGTYISNHPEEYGLELKEPDLFIPLILVNNNDKTQKKHNDNKKSFSNIRLWKFENFHIITEM